MKLLKKFVRTILDRTVVPVARYIRYQTYAAVPIYTVQQELARRTAAECADYVQSEMPVALQFSTREELWEYVWEQKKSVGLVAEFGVWNGYSINRIAQKTDQLVYGFDSFAGLREDWSGGGFAKGKFDLGGRLPVVAQNVRLIKGWFDETLPQFLVEHGEPFAFIHIDCDTYEAAKTILDLVETRILEGTVVVFDEYFGYRGWRLGEFKAWREFALRNKVRYEYLGYSSTQVAVQVVRIAQIKPTQAENRNLVPCERSSLPAKTSIVQE